MKPRPRYPIEVVSIESIDHGHRRLVTLVDTRDGTTHKLIYGDSVTERTIRIKAPFLIKTGGRR
ncbi:hypothetical protein DFP98_10351 [Cohnella phaseoli]|uniref:Uncharacterized protein n=1 Tax=Cohnella phaseoli TaxID=456490 RepID=A0A3D9KIQ9_9BACL|nr:hypothetical protein DFP98_10351 [Cohnella phaseoli]